MLSEAIMICSSYGIQATRVLDLGIQATGVLGTGKTPKSLYPFNLRGKSDS